MSAGSTSDLTVLLEAARGGDREAFDRVFRLVYAELRSLAAAALAGEREGHTLQPTALAHEAYLRLIKQHSGSWKDRAEFMGVAAKVMRRILVDHARARKAEKRGGGAARIPLDDTLLAFEERAIDLVALDEALEELGGLDERKTRIVELRFFMGMTMDEVSNLLGVPVRTVERDWAMARAWLRDRIDGGARA